jgi:thioredoxin 1
MILRRTLLSFAVFACFSSAFAGERALFDKDNFEKAQAQGKRILVEVSAPWCPTCKAQAPIIEKYTKLPAHKDVMIFMVDFDTMKDELKYFNARSQSTLIMFKGKKETGRSAGDTTDDGIGKLIQSSL